MTDLPPRLPRALRTAFREELDQGQRAALLSWLAFATTFAAVRGITWSIRAGRGPRIDRASARKPIEPRIIGEWRWSSICSTSCMSAAATNGLVVEAMWNRACGLTGRRESPSFITPKPRE